MGVGGKDFFSFCFCFVLFVFIFQLQVCFTYRPFYVRVGSDTKLICVQGHRPQSKMADLKDAVE